MKNKQLFLVALILLTSCFIWGQSKADQSKINISGKIVEGSTKKPLQYATITLKNTNNAKMIFGGVSDENGAFSVEAVSGIYDIILEFISFKSKTISQRSLLENTNLGTISLEEDVTQLNEVVIQNEKSTVEFKLDKKVYNVGKDLTVKGGTVSDVLDNIPSVSVDVDGTVSLRGNSNVKILIDGKPSSAINITEALRLIPSDAIDKVEIITNPSARYDAEGGGGIINILLKKGKNKGLSGSFTASTGYPNTYGLTGTVNYRAKKFNLFTTQGYNYRKSPGNAFTNSRYLNEDGTTVQDPTKSSFMNESHQSTRLRKAYNSIVGVDWYLDKSTTWTNTVTYRETPGTNLDDVFQNFYDVNHVYQYANNRYTNENDFTRSLEYSTDLIHNFKKEGHKLTFNTTISNSIDNTDALITNSSSSSSTPITYDQTTNDQKQNRFLIQSDYILPIGKGGQFEAGYRGNFFNTTTNYSVITNGVPSPNFTNILEYKQKVNALYSQYGFKKNKFSSLLGLRWEDSNIDVNQLVTSDYHNKKYNNFFPSAFLSYEIEKGNTLTLSYSRRIQRPDQRQLNPFSNYSSNVNIFVGNPDLNPSFTDVIDMGYLKTWNKLTFNTSLYGNHTTGVIQYVRTPTQMLVNGVPVIITSPINLSTEYRAGLELTLNYTPYKWWKLNGNFNYFYLQTDGSYTYTDSNGKDVFVNLDFKTSTWLTKLSSKVTLPYKIDWQTNFNYNANQKNAQGHTIGTGYFTLAFNKDVLKDKASINFNVSDVFNSRKRKVATYIPGSVDSYSEMQFRVRQFNISFTYRFNKPTTEKEKAKKPANGNDDNDIPGN